MRIGPAISVLVGWVLLVSQGCGGEKFESQAGDGGESGTAEGGAPLGGSAGALAGVPAASGGTEAGGGEQTSGGYPSGGAPAASGGAETDGGEQTSGGYPSGGAPSGGVAVVTNGGSSTGGVAVAINGGSSSGGVRTGGAPSGGFSVVTGGLSSGGRATGGVPNGGFSVVTGGLSSGGRATGGVPSGGTATGGAVLQTGGSGTGGSVGTGGAGEVCTCNPGLNCCSGNCVNLMNDLNNCGKCGSICSGPKPFCAQGICGAAPCSGMMCTVTAACCGSVCCSDTEICCNVPAAVESGPRCVPPVNGTCPVGCPTCTCASPDTSIATPQGPRPMAALNEGDLVYSVDRGHIVAVPVVRTRRIAATTHHVVVRMTLTSGSVLEISAPHPTADGRQFGELRAGDQLGGFGVAQVELVPYRHAFTYDILPASDSGTYFAEGALVGSTLAGPAQVAMSVAAP